MQRNVPAESSSKPPRWHTSQPVNDKYYLHMLLYTYVLPVVSMYRVPVMEPSRFASAINMWLLRGQMWSPSIFRPEPIGNRISL